MSHRKKDKTRNHKMKENQKKNKKPLKLVLMIARSTRRIIKTNHRLNHQSLSSRRDSEQLIHQPLTNFFSSPASLETVTISHIDKPDINLNFTII